jgi:UDP-glucose 4-epimerase
VKVFITGVGGFLGSHLADRLISKGHSVVGVDNFIGGYRDNVNKNVTLHEIDLAETNKISEIMAGADVVCHTACTAYEGLSVFSPSLITQNTFQITSSALSAAVQNRVKRFVYCSSMARYGYQDTVPFTEDMTPQPIDPYGIAKLASEELVKNLCTVHGINYSIAVPHNIIGPRQKYDDPFRNVASIMINLMLQRRQPIVYGDGQQKRCFSYIDDDIYCLERMCLEDIVDGEIINIGPDEEVITINELAETIASLLGFNLNPEYHLGRPQEVKFATCSADKARKLLNYRTETSLKDSLQKMIEYIETRGVRPFEYHLPVEIENDLTPRTWTQKLF